MIERLAAWYRTGPLGHFVAGAADWAQWVSAHLWRRARERARARLAAARRPR
ncbi:MAG: hypothetical protein IRZ32_11705 [Solirubrobacteraceae bacterium]|nr:hypothetical protein [Solirubrobacteraceae bacterium]